VPYILYSAVFSVVAFVYVLGPPYPGSYASCVLVWLTFVGWTVCNIKPDLPPCMYLPDLCR